MRRLYWRPYRISRITLLAITLLSILSLVAVESFRKRETDKYYDLMIEASKLAEKYMKVIREECRKRGIKIKIRYDPCESCLIGEWMTPVTSMYGNLHAKQTSINPNFSAVIVKMLKEAGVKKGDVVAVGFSGSFPALNLCVHAAVKTLGVKPVIISSVAASQWGANREEFLWIDMEATLRRYGLIDFTSVACSVGGRQDRGVGMPEEGIRLIEEAIKRNNVRLIKASSYEDSVAQRLSIYREFANNSKVAAYINVGGGTASVGSPEDRKKFSPGLNVEPDVGESVLDSVMFHFAKMGVPIINLSRIHILSKEYGLPWRPKSMPEVGEGKVYECPDYNRLLAGFLLFVIIVILLLCAYKESKRNHPIVYDSESEGL